MRNHARVKAVTLCAALVSMSLWAQAQSQSTEPVPRAVPPEAGVPLTANAPPLPAAPAAPLTDPVAEAFAALDRDGDGKVSAVEHAEGAKARFDALDADHSYHLSTAEMEQATATDAAVAGQLAAGTVSTAANANDDNDNGEISPEESRTQAEAEFLARDADRDGSLSLEEMRRVVAPAAASTPDN
jgi:Ca2+-binding EF-hand superfamily protein